MASILDTLLARVQAVQAGLLDGSLIREALASSEQAIIEAQRRQLLAGKDSGGEDIRPFYSEDLKPSGHFYSVESAGRYAAWKQDLSYPYTVDRNPDAPNLYINGKFHNELGVDLGVDAIGIIGETAYARNIMAKYGQNTFGLNYDSWQSVWEGGAYDLLMINLSTYLFQ